MKSIRRILDPRRPRQPGRAAVLLPLLALLPALVPADVRGQALAAGAEHSVVLLNGETSASPGSPWAWGENRKGQLGTGDQTDRLAPVRVDEGNDWDAVSAGAGHTVALRGGRLFTWGDNASGQLGLGDTAPRSSPTQVGVATDWAAVAAGGYHTLALKTDGSLWAAGSNATGQLGAGAMTHSTDFVQIGGAGDLYAAIAAGTNHSLGIRGGAVGGKGTLWGWGSNIEGATGTGPGLTPVDEPAQLGTSAEWFALAAGGSHSLALREEGTPGQGSLWAWGRNREGQLGLNVAPGGSTAPRRSPTQVGTGTDWTAVAAGGKHSLAIVVGNGLRVWGSNDSGQLGLGENAGRGAPAVVTLSGDEQWAAVAAGGAHTLVAATDGRVFAAGSNEDGQLGVAGATSRSTLVEITFEGGTTLPDFSLGAIAVPLPSTVLTAGQEVAFNFILSNGGADHPGGGAAVEIRVLLSSDEVVDGGDAQVVSIAHTGALAAGASVALDDSFTVPDVLPQGDYRILFQVDADDAVVEDDETNNVAAAAPTYTVFPVAQPDFAITAVAAEIEVETITGGESVPFSASVFNFGSDHAAEDGSFDLAVSLTTDSAPGEALATVTINRAIGRGQTATVTGTVAVPTNLAAGDYFFVFEVDAGGAVAELDETNNVLSGTDAVTVLPPPDFSFLAVGASPAELRPGADLVLSATVANNHGAFLDGRPTVPIQVSLTSDGILGNADDILVGEFGIDVGIPAGGSLMLEVSSSALPVEISAGTYRFGFEVNPPGEGATAEQSTDNNRRLTDDSFEFFPDLAIDSTSIGSAQLVPGAELSFNVVVSNQGAGFDDNAANVEVGVFLSTDATIDGGDILLGTTSFDSGLDFGGTIPLSGGLTLPASIASGTYQIGFRVNSNDAFATEIDRGNNDSFNATRFGVFPDFVIDSFIVPDAGVVPGGSLGFKVTSRNLGGEFNFAGSPVSVGVHLTADAVFGNADDVVLTGTIDHGADLISGATFTDSFGFGVPDDVPAGTYNFAAKVDSGGAGFAGTVNESNEANNVALSTVTVDLLADVQTQTFTHTGGTYSRGDDLPVEAFSFANASPFAVPEGSEIHVQVRLSKDRIWGNFDDVILVEDLPIIAPASFKDGGAIISAAIADAEIPPETPAGFYFAGVRLDFPDLITEVDDTNNTIFSNLADVEIMGEDLAAALEDTLPAPADPGNPGFGERRGLSPSLGGVSSWFGQAIEVDPSGGAAAGQSGKVGDGQESFVEVALFEPERFQFSFLWKVDSEQSFDFLIFSVNGEELASISGDQDWAPFNLTLEAGSYTFRWTYRKDANESKRRDAGWVDSLTVNTPPPLSDENPDFIVRNAEFEAGTYIVQRDRLVFNTIGANLGGDIPLTNLPLAVEAVLSLDREIGNGDDIVLTTIRIPELLARQDQFIDASDIMIPSTNRSGQVVPRTGNYFLGLRIDPVSAQKPTGNYDELNENNNIFFSPQPSIVVETRADIRLESFSYDGGQFAYGDQINLSFDLVNGGLRDIPSVRDGGRPIRIQVNLSTSEVPLATVNLTEGLRINERRFIQMAVDVVDGFPISSECGVLNVLADTAAEIDEALEDNNTTGNTELDTIVTGIPLGVALDLPQLRWVRGGSFCRAWTGDTEMALDRVDVATAPTNLDEEETATFTTNIFIDEPSFFSFSVTGETLFQLRKDGEVVESIVVGNEEVGIYRGHIFALEAGSFYDLSFLHGVTVFLDNGEEKRLAGAAFVDEARLFLPQLKVDELAFLPPGGGGSVVQTVDREGAIDTGRISFKVSNDGQAAVPPNTPLVFQFVLSGDVIFGNEDDILIRSRQLGFLNDFHTIRLDQEVAVGDPPPPVQITEEFNLVVPEYTPPGAYFLGVNVNATGRVIEGDRSDNIVFSSRQGVVVPGPGAGGSAITVAEAIDADLTFARGTEVPWFGFLAANGAAGDTADGVDAVRTPFIEEGKETFFETTVVGPAEIGFSWMGKLVENLNSINFLVDGRISRRITGDTPYTEEKINIPIGSHDLRWVYVKGRNSATDDGGFVDQFTVNQFDIDLQAISFPAGAALNRGDSLSVDLTLFNGGTVDFAADAGIVARVFLTQNLEAGDVDDVPLTTFTIDVAIPSGGTEVVNVAVPVPSTANPGSYTVGAVVDVTDQFVEIDEINNARVNVADTFDVVAPTVDEGMDLTFNDFPGGFVPPVPVFSGTSSWFGEASTLEGNTGDDVSRSPTLFNAGDTAAFTISVEGPINVAFNWMIASGTDTLTFSVDGEEQASIVGTEPFQPFALLVTSADSPRDLTWTYTRTQDEADDPGAAAFVDNLSITHIDLPDLEVAELQFNSGTFVLQDTSTFLEVFVVGINNGVDIEGRPADPESGFFDVEVRLSRDRIWGNTDDIVLGKLKELEVLDGGSRFISGQFFEFDRCLPEGEYFLGAFADSTELYTEFDEQNNFAFSDGPTIVLDARPNLVIENFNYRPGKHFRRGELLVSFDIHNRGCEDFPAGSNLDIVALLKGLTEDIVTAGEGTVAVIAEHEELDRTILDIDETRGIKIDSTARYTAALQIPAYNETGIVNVFGGDNTDMSIPDTTDPMEGPDGDDDPDTFDPATDSDLEVEFSLLLEISATGTPLVFSPVSTAAVNPRNNPRDIRIEATPVEQDYNEFKAFWDDANADRDTLDPEDRDIGDAMANFDGDAYKNIEEFLLGLDPTRPEPAGLPVIGFVRTQTAEGERRFMSATFNMLSPRANGVDATYTLEASDTADFAAPIAILAIGPDDTVETIIGNGGLSVINNGYLRRVTVRDNVAVEDLSSRFVRVRVTGPGIDEIIPPGG